MNIDPKSWAVARKATRGTLKAGDKEKWAAYEALLSPTYRQQWRLREGHAEYCRLQRLAFHGYI